jgi:hypothetical protein
MARQWLTNYASGVYFSMWCEGRDEGVNPHDATIPLNPGAYDCSDTTGQSIHRYLVGGFRVNIQLSQSPIYVKLVGLR